MVLDTPGEPRKERPFDRIADLPNRTTGLEYGSEGSPVVDATARVGPWQEETEMNVHVRPRFVVGAMQRNGSCQRMSTVLYWLRALCC
jgi:hypothetical protein